jgi:mRNA interferase RelE/StbE
VEAYAIEVEPRVLRSLRRINQAGQRRILDRIESLAADPRPAGCEKLQGAEGLRVRQGDYRIIYTIDDSKRVVTVTKVGHRRDVYR